MAMPLACVGGFLDAYTFVGYNGVFANAQTGNVDRWRVSHTSAQLLQAIFIP
jgi:uncharacterized membrane protein YoaK (UPF0700 family)